MAREYGFTPKEKQTYYQQQKLYSSFGRDLINDYIALCVYGLDDVLIGTRIKRYSTKTFNDNKRSRGTNQKDCYHSKIRS